MGRPLKGEDGEGTTALLAAAEAFTVTSNKLAGLVQSRGFYVEGRGNPSGKPSGKPSGGLGLAVPITSSLCLGCWASDHWISPHVTQYQAQMASADLELDPEGVPVVDVWMLSTETGPIAILGVNVVLASSATA